MHAGLAREQAEGEIAGDGEGDRLDAGLIAVLDFVNLGFEALALRPAQVHAHQHLGPVLRFGASRTGMHSDDRVQRIGFAGEHGLGFELLGEVDQRRDFSLEVGLDRLAFLGEFEVGLDVVLPAGEFGVVGQQRFQALALAHQGLRFCAVGPDRGVGNLLFN